MKTLIVVQARMASTRLPGKVLLPLAGRPLLARLLERVLAADAGAETCVATTPAAEDEPIRALCRELGVRSIDGHPSDLVLRHYQAARELGAEVVVKIPSDCPLIEPGVIERVLATFRADPSVDFVTNLFPPSFPDGNDVELLPIGVLETVLGEARTEFEREHTTPFVWLRPERFRIRNVRADGPDLSTTHRLTIDYREDYALIAAVYTALFRPERPIFRLDEIVHYLARHPEVRLLNARYHGRTYASDLASNLASNFGSHHAEQRPTRPSAAERR